MIDRYTRPEMGRIWSEENKYRQWLEVELAAAEALAELGEVPTEAATRLRQHARFDVRRIQEIEREVRHDVIAFTTAVAESMAAAGHAEASRWLHFGLTSNDVVDTAQALLVRDASEIIAQGLAALKQGKAIRYEGPGGPTSFDSFHDSTGIFQVDTYSGSGAVQVTGNITAAQLRAVS